jgi:uncharacterized membrane protein (DUF106 family)
MELMSLITNYPVYSIIVLSAIVTLISTLVTKWLTNQDHLRSLKERQKQIQKDLKKCKPGDKIFEELQSEMLQITMTMMKSSFKPLLITFIPFLLLLGWIRNTYEPILPGWIWYYIIASVAASLVYRKLFKMA